jgi:lincosamide nucleotidyltransferase A/C/D/E
MINENNVLDLLQKVKHIGIEIWIAGGWGVDALIGQQTRPHDDIDIFLQKKDSTLFTEMLISNGYREIKVEFNSKDNPVWCDSENHIIDIHLFEFVDAGNFRYDNVIYPSEILNGKGTIGGITVRCMSAKAQVQYHQGYEQKEKDRHDVLLLCKTFGISVPEGYEIKQITND